MLQEGTTELRSLHDHNSRRPEGYLGYKGRRVENGFASGQGTDGQAMDTGKRRRKSSFRSHLVLITTWKMLHWFIFNFCNV